MSKKIPINLIAFSINILLLIFCLILFQNYFKNVEDRIIHRIIETEFPQIFMGTSLQKAALSQEDILVVIGSSEMGSDIKEFTPTAFFYRSPTGFIVLPVIRGGNYSLDIAQDVASLGPALRDKKVVISFSPGMFLEKQVSEEYYQGNFSQLHALELTFSPYLSLNLKKMAARRMLDYPKTLENDPILRFALTHLASDKPVDDLFYYFSIPIGWTEIFFIRNQDKWEVINFSRHNNIPHRPIVSENINWEKLKFEAINNRVNLTSHNNYGIDNFYWDLNYRNFKPAINGAGDQKFIDDLNNSKEWVDFDILLSILNQFGAHPLILGRPLNGKLLQDELGISSSARQRYYEKLENEVKKFGFKLVDFAEYDNDPYFSVDISSHTSQSGFVIINQTIDDFYHDPIR